MSTVAEHGIEAGSESVAERIGVDQIRSLQEQHLEDYRRIVWSMANGEQVDEHELTATLTIIGKSLDVLLVDVEFVRQRIRNAARLSSAAGLGLSVNRLKAEMQEARATLEQRQPEIEQEVNRLHLELQQLGDDYRDAKQAFRDAESEYGRVSREAEQSLLTTYTPQLDRAIAAVSAELAALNREYPRPANLGELQERVAKRREAVEEIEGLRLLSRYRNYRSAELSRAKHLLAAAEHELRVAEQVLAAREAIVPRMNELQGQLEELQRRRFDPAEFALPEERPPQKAGFQANLYR